MEKNNPATKPGQFTTSGSRRTRRSVIVRTITKHVKTSHFTVCGVNPKST